MSTSLDINFPRFLKDAFFNQKKHTCVAAGRRTGKTYNAFQWLLIELLRNKNVAGLWVDTTQRNLTEYIDIYVRKILGPIWDSCKYDKQGHKLTLPSGSFLHLRSAEVPQNMEGFEYDFVVCNEAGIIFKKHELWLNTVQPMCKKAVVKLVGTPKGKNYFYDLCQNQHTEPERWATHQFSAYDSPYWEHGELAAIKRDPAIPIDVWEQEYLGQFITITSNVIVKRSFKESWRDDDDKPYYIDHSFIRRQLADDGYYFISFDGGMHTTHSAAILGYHNKRYVRDILLKEFYNTNKNENLREIAQMIDDFCHENNIDINGIRMYGDPAIKTHGDDELIHQVLGMKPDLLQGLKDSEDNEAKNAFRDRKKRRLTLLNRDIYSMASDNKPRIIILKDANTQQAQTYGCPNLYNGLFNGQYRYEIKDIAGRSFVTEDLEQIAPVTDIADAYTYFILAERYKERKERGVGRLRLKVLR